LRARSAWSFALLALALSVALSLGTYHFSRWYLLGQREELATRQAMVNALIAQGFVAGSGAGAADVQAALGALPDARSVLRLGGSWYSAVVELTNEAIPDDLVALVSSTGPARQRVSVSDTPYVVVGVALPGVDGEYFEFVSLAEYERTLSTLATVLVIAASVTTLLGAAAGWLLSRRLVRPLTSIAAAARSVSDGDLSRRLDGGDDPDLEPVVDSFNEMAASLQRRIERELRFTADVSHELRTPLTAMASAVSLAQRSELEGRAKLAVDILDEQVDHLRQLTLELLEISHIDAGATTLDLQPTDVVDATRRVVAAAGFDEALVVSELGDPVHLVDPVRFERILANLVENAERYGAGPTRVTLARDAGRLVVTVDDDGPGVPPDERVAIFGRFHRGAAQAVEGAPKGTGLGLALVDEHVRLHGGEVHATDSPSGGARFVVVIPEAPCAG
jgi:signal transduction histidine kinase